MAVRSSSMRGGGSSPERSSLNPFAAAGINSPATPYMHDDEDDEDDEDDDDSQNEDDELTARLDPQLMSSAITLSGCTVSDPRYVQDGAMSGHVEYLVTFIFIGSKIDASSPVSEVAKSRKCVWKRYSDFLKLFKALTSATAKKDAVGRGHAARVSDFDFPRKRVTSHKKDSVKDGRCAKFDALMKIVAGLQPTPRALEAWLAEARPLDANSTAPPAAQSASAEPAVPSLSPVKNLDGDFEAHGGNEETPQSPPSPPRGPIRNVSLSPGNGVRDEGVHANDEGANKSRGSAYSSLLAGTSSSGQSGTVNDDRQSSGVVERIMTSTAAKRYSESELKREVASAESRAREGGIRDVARLEQRHQLEKEAFAASKKRLQDELNIASEQLRSCKDQMRLKASEWESERRELLRQATSEREALAALSAHRQYIRAVGCLRVRIATWEKDTRDRHVRYLVTVTSDFNAYGKNARPSSSSSSSSSSYGKVKNGDGGGGRGRIDGDDKSDDSNSTEEETDLNYDTDESGGDTSNSGAQESVFKHELSGPGVDSLVRHRYSEFRSLARSLGIKTSTLPPKSYFSLGRNALAERAEALQSFMNDIVLPRFSLDQATMADGSHEQRHPLRDFLGLPPPPPVSERHAALGAERAKLSNFRNISALVDAVSGKGSSRSPASYNNSSGKRKSREDMVTDARAAASTAPPEDSESLDQLGELRSGSELLGSSIPSDGDAFDARLSTMTAVLDS